MTTDTTEDAASKPLSIAEMRARQAERRRATEELEIDRKAYEETLKVEIHRYVLESWYKAETFLEDLKAKIPARFTQFGVPDILKQNPFGSEPAEGACSLAPCDSQPSYESVINLANATLPFPPPSTNSSLPSLAPSTFPTFTPASTTCNVPPPNFSQVHAESSFPVLNLLGSSSSSETAPPHSTSALPPLHRSQSEAPSSTRFPLSSIHSSSSYARAATAEPSHPKPVTSSSADLSIRQFDDWTDGVLKGALGTSPGASYAPPEVPLRAKGKAASLDKQLRQNKKKAAAAEIPLTYGSKDHGTGIYFVPSTLPLYTKGRAAVVDACKELGWKLEPGLLRGDSAETVERKIRACLPLVDSRTYEARGIELGWFRAAKAPNKWLPVHPTPKANDKFQLCSFTISSLPGEGVHQFFFTHQAFIIPIAGNTTSLPHVEEFYKELGVELASEKSRSRIGGKSGSKPNDSSYVPSKMITRLFPLTEEEEEDEPDENLTANEEEEEEEEEDQDQDQDQDQDHDDDQEDTGDDKEREEEVKEGEECRREVSPAVTRDGGDEGNQQNSVGGGQGESPAGLDAQEEEPDIEVPAAVGEGEVELEDGEDNSRNEPISLKARLGEIPPDEEDPLLHAMAENWNMYRDLPMARAASHRKSLADGSFDETICSKCKAPMPEFPTPELSQLNSDPSSQANILCKRHKAEFEYQTIILGHSLPRGKDLRPYWSEIAKYAFETFNAKIDHFDGYFKTEFASKFEVKLSKLFRKELITIRSWSTQSFASYEPAKAFSPGYMGPHLLKIVTAIVRNHYFNICKLKPTQPVRTGSDIPNDAFVSYVIALELAVFSIDANYQWWAEKCWKRDKTFVPGYSAGEGQLIIDQTADFGLVFSQDSMREKDFVKVGEELSDLLNPPPPPPSMKRQRTPSAKALVSTKKKR